MTRSSIIESLLAECRSKDIRLDLGPEGLLELDFPKGALTEALRERLIEHKAELIAVLCDPLAAVPCPWCNAPLSTDGEVADGIWCIPCKRLAWWFPSPDLARNAKHLRDYPGFDPRNPWRTLPRGKPTIRR